MFYTDGKMRNFAKMAPYWVTIMAQNMGTARVPRRGVLKKRVKLPKCPFYANLQKIGEEVRSTKMAVLGLVCFLLIPIVDNMYLPQ